MTTPADDTLTTKTVAERLGTDPKTLRVFLRATSQGVGSGRVTHSPLRTSQRSRRSSPSGQLNAKLRRRRRRTRTRPSPPDHTDRSAAPTLDIGWGLFGGRHLSLRGSCY